MIGRLAAVADPVKAGRGMALPSRSAARALGRLALVVVSAVGCSPETRAGPWGRPPTLGEFALTPMDVAGRMLTLAEVTAKDLVYDLGSGDGRLVILAAKRYGARVSASRSTLPTPETSCRSRRSSPSPRPP